MLRYSHPVHPGFILHFVAQGDKKYPEPCPLSVRGHRGCARRIVGRTIAPSTNEVGVKRKSRNVKTELRKNETYLVARRPNGQ